MSEDLHAKKLTEDIMHIIADVREQDKAEIKRLEAENAEMHTVLKRVASLAEGWFESDEETGDCKCETLLSFMIIVDQP